MGWSRGGPDVQGWTPGLFEALSEISGNPVCAAIAWASSQDSVFTVLPRVKLSPQSHVGDVSPAQFKYGAGKAPGIVPLK